MLLGWPAVVLAVTLGIAGVALNKPALVWVGLILALPFSFYLAGTPRFGFLGFAMAAFLAGGAAGVSLGRKRLAWCGVVLFCLCLATIAVLLYGSG